MNNEPTSTSSAGEPSSILLSTLEKVLRPLVRLMLSYQITYPQLIGMLKMIYVDVAEKEFQVNNKRQSDSRINLLTGVHRKDVKRLRAEPKAINVAPATASTGARLIGHWLGHSDFTDSEGNPRPLPLKAQDDRQPDFEQLVETVCKQDIRPRVILDEWLRLGVAHITEDKLVLNTGAFTPQQGFAEKLFFFGKNIQDHISAGSHNLLGLKPSYFDRSVYYEKLTRDSIEELSELANSLGMQALTAMNKEALARQQQDSNNAGAVYRMNFGIFNFNAEVPTHQADDLAGSD